MHVSELAAGLWRWTAPHPDWTPDQGGPDGWERDVSSYYAEVDGALLLFDPLVPGDAAGAERFWRALDRDVERLGPPSVLLTVFWHARSSAAVLDRYPGARVWAHERAAGELRERTRVTDAFALGDTLPGGVEPRDALRAGEVLYWLPAHRALVAGDVLLGAAGGSVRLCPDAWLPRDVEPATVRASLLPLLELPVERLLLTHGEPVLDDARGALERALTA